MTTSRFLEVERDGVGLILWTSDRFPPGTVAAFSTRRGGVSTGPYATLNLSLSGGDEPRAAAENHRRFRQAAGVRGPVYCARQVHGNRVVAVDDLAGEPAAAGLRRAGEADGLLTARPGRFLLTFHADCLPIFLVDPEAPVAVLLHAGWRGTTAGIAVEGVRAATAAGARPDRILAGIGPGVGPCCYEVDGPVIDRVRQVLGDGAAAVLKPAGPGRAYLDLWETNRRLLAAAGVREENIAVAGICTCCDARRFFSYRRARGAPLGQMAAVLGFSAGAGEAGAA
ncbi:MAG: peptidoglycan editing factor PgeF [Thermaerobacter sp.]|nr:peptidoglycan editing factor PgeF [Bacillota bacterium]